MKQRRKITLTYRCNACIRKDLADKGYSCKFITDTQTDSQGWCISRCPIFGDEFTPEWNLISEVKE